MLFLSPLCAGFYHVGHPGAWPLPWLPSFCLPASWGTCLEALAEAALPGSHPAPTTARAAGYREQSLPPEDIRPSLPLSSACPSECARAGGQRCGHGENPLRSRLPPCMCASRRKCPWVTAAGDHWLWVLSSQLPWGGHSPPRPAGRSLTGHP